MAQAKRNGEQRSVASHTLNLVAKSPRDLQGLLDELREDLFELEAMVLRESAQEDGHHRHRALNPGEYVSEYFRESRLRRQVLGPVLSTEPAWAIIVNLYAAHLAQHRLTIGRLATCAALPNTTVLRWLRTLEDRTMVTLREDPLDQRRRYVELTAGGAEAIGRFVDLLTSRSEVPNA